MHSFRSKLDVFTISPASLTLTLAVLVTLGLAVVLAEGGSRLTSLLLGSDATGLLVDSTQKEVGGSLEFVFSSPLLGRAVVFSVWAFVGMLTLTILGVISSAVGNLRTFKEQLNYLNQDKRLFRHTLVQKAALRLGIAVIWAAFTYAFFQYIVSFFMVTLYVALNSGFDLVAVLQGVLGVVVLAIGIHIHIIAARLFVGRVRLWGD